MDETLTFVSLDIANDKVRRRVCEMLLDYDLKREHYSLFAGLMTRNRREELYVRLRVALREQFEEDDGFGRVTVIPVSEREAGAILRFIVGTPGRRKTPEKEARPDSAAPADAPAAAVEPAQGVPAAEEPAP